MNLIEPTPDSLARFRDAPIHGRIHMLNLLKFSEAGKPAYLEYSARIAPMLAAHRARIVYEASGAFTLIGEQTWDSVISVEYPSKSAYLTMFDSAAYAEIAGLRQRALRDSRLYCLHGESFLSALENFYIGFREKV